MYGNCAVNWSTNKASEVRARVASAIIMIKEITNIFSWEGYDHRLQGQWCDSCDATETSILRQD